MSYGTPDGEYGKMCRAAIVTFVSPEDDEINTDEQVSLCVMNPTGLFFDLNCSHSEPVEYAEKVGGTWHWPEPMRTD